jgi:transposase
VSLLAGLNLEDAKVIPLVRDTHTSRDFIDWLKLVNATYADAEKIKILLDNHSVHTSKETREYLASVPGRFEFVFTPKHGSWLNLVESFFGKLARSFLRNLRVASKQELIDRLYQYIETINEEPVVYHWKYKMDEIDDMAASAEPQA